MRLLFVLTIANTLAILDVTAATGVIGLSNAKLVEVQKVQLDRYNLLTCGETRLPLLSYPTLNEVAKTSRTDTCAQSQHADYSLGSVASYMLLPIPSTGSTGLQTIEMSNPPARRIAANESAQGQPKRTTRATHGSVTFTLNTGGLTTGNYADGPAYVVIPSGTSKLSEPKPTQSTVDGGLVNGTMVNYQALTGQGWDGRHNVQFDASAANANWPLTVEAGDIITKAVSEIRTPPKSRRGLISEYATLYVVDSVPESGSFAPTSVSWPERGTPKSPKLTKDISSFVAGLPSYDDKSFAPRPYNQLMAIIDHWTPFWGVNYKSASPGYQAFVPPPMRYGNKNNWGGYLADPIQDASLALISDSYTTAQKEAIATRLFSMGREMYEPSKGMKFSQTYRGNGGHFQFHLGPVMIYLTLTGDTIGIENLLKDIPGNFAGAFEVTPALKARMVPHDNNSDPSAYRRRTISAISDNELTLESFGSGYESYRQKYEGTYLTNGLVRSLVTAMPDNNNSKAAPDGFVATVADATGFAAGDKVWVESNYEREIGEFDWAVWEVPRRFKSYYQSPHADYRGLNKWSGFLMFMEAAGMMDGGEFDALRGYIIGANRADFPAADFDWPDHHHSKYARRFWDAHWDKMYSP